MTPRDFRQTRVTRRVSTVVVLGFAIRLLLAPWTGSVIDDSVWYRAAANGMHGVGIYERLQFSYPPVWGYLLQGVGWVMVHAGLHPTNLAKSDSRLLPAILATNAFSTTVTTPLFAVAYKLVLIAFDFLTACLLRTAATRLRAADAGQRAGERAGRLAFMSWWLNPFVILEVAGHGALDVIVGFSILLTLVLLLSGRDTWAGAALAFGVLSKISPIFIGPAAVAFIVVTSEPGKRIRRVAAFFTGGAIATTVLLLPVVLSGQLRAAINASTSRVGTGSVVGGVSVFGLKNLRFLSWITDAVNNHRAVVGLLTSAIQLVSALAVAAWVLRSRRGDPAFRLVAATTLVLVVVVTTSPLSNPQYLLWLLPGLVLLASVWDAGAWQSAVLSVSAAMYDLALLGPLAFVAPAAVAVGVPSVTTVSRSIVLWQNLRAPFWATTGRGSVLVLCALLILGALVGLSVTLVRHQPPPPETTRPRRGSLRRSPGNWPVAYLQRLTLVVVALTLAAAFVSYPRRHPAAPKLTVVRDATGIRVNAHGGVDRATQRLRMVAVPVSDIRPKNIAVYMDDAYGVRGTDQRTAKGIFDHLHAELILQRYPGHVALIDAAAFASALRDIRSAPSTIIVAMTGVFPAAVFSTTTDLVSRWVDAGGVLVWGGTPVGVWSAPPSSITNRSPEDISAGPQGVERLLGPGFIGTPPDLRRYAVERTPMAQALGLEYQDTGVGLLDTGSRAHRKTIGWASSGRSSISLVRRGRGSFVLFEGPIFFEEIVVSDLSRLILAGGLSATGPIRWRDVDSSAVARHAGFAWQTSVGSGPVIVSLLDPAPDGVVFTRSGLG
ncbi:MAG: hypothetical protein QOG50_1988 [Actinomycetota bacterium]|nr:hypothetical protein [Actinomycetota bacterium]